MHEDEDSSGGNSRIYHISVALGGLRLSTVGNGMPGIAAVSIGDQLAAMCSSLPAEVHVDLSGEDLFSAKYQI